MAHQPVFRRWLSVDNAADEHPSEWPSRHAGTPYVVAIQHDTVRIEDVGTMTEVLVGQIGSIDVLVGYA